MVVLIPITGISGSGKTESARRVRELLERRQIPVVCLSGDDFYKNPSEIRACEIIQRTQYDDQHLVRQHLLDECDRNGKLRDISQVITEEDQRLIAWYTALDWDAPNAFDWDAPNAFDWDSVLLQLDDLKEAHFCYRNGTVKRVHKNDYNFALNLRTRGQEIYPGKVDLSQFHHPLVVLFEGMYVLCNHELVSKAKRIVVIKAPFTNACAWKYKRDWLNVEDQKIRLMPRSKKHTTGGKHMLHLFLMIFRSVFLSVLLRSKTLPSRANRKISI